MIESPQQMLEIAGVIGAVVTVIAQLARISARPKEREASLRLVRDWGPSTLLFFSGLLAFTSVSVVVPSLLNLIALTIFVLNFVLDNGSQSRFEVVALVLVCSLIITTTASLLVLSLLSRVIGVQEKSLSLQLQTIRQQTAIQNPGTSQPPSPGPREPIQNQEGLSDSDSQKSAKDQQPPPPKSTPDDQVDPKQNSRPNQNSSSGEHGNPSISGWTIADFWVTAFFSLCLVVVGSLQGWATWRQAGYMETQLKIAQDTAAAAKQSADTAAEQLRLQQRPWVSIRRFEMKRPRIGKQVDCRFEFNNTGNSPAIRRHEFFAVELIPVPDAGNIGLGSDADSRPPTKETANAALPPHSRTSCRVNKSPVMTKQTIAAIKDGKALLCFLGQLIYTDTQGEARYKTVICVQYDWKLGRLIGAPDTDSFRMT